MLTLVGLPARASEVAILRNGFTLQHDHHDVRGAVVRLYFTEKEDSFADFPIEEISGYEKLETAERPIKAQTAKAAERSAMPLEEIVNSVSASHRIDPDLIRSMIRVESGFDTNAISPKGARGLMQLMPRTAKSLGVGDAFDAKANIEGGTQYIDDLLSMFDDDVVKALAAYNAGPERVNRYHGVPPFQETQRYVARILSDFRRQKQMKKAAPQGDTSKSRMTKKVDAGFTGSNSKDTRLQD